MLNLNRTGNKSWIIIGGLVLAGVLSVTPFIDQRAEGNYESLFQRALVTFALARTLNGVISVVQGTELALQPAGVGLTLTPGEILDPVNDLVERFSWIMLGATVSLGIQQVLLHISAWWLLQGLVAALAIWLILLNLSIREAAATQKRVLTKVFLVALFLRFAVPLTLIANDAVYQLFLEQRYAQSSVVVSEAGEEISQLGEAGPEPEAAAGRGGMFGSLSQAMDSTREALNLREKVERIKARAGQLVEHVIQLAVVFVLQTGILPIVFLWLFLQAAKWVIGFRKSK